MNRPSTRLDQDTAILDSAMAESERCPSTHARGFALPALTPGWFALLLVAMVFVAYPEVMLGTHTFFYRDYAQFGYPLAWHLKQSFAQGEIPLWNPLNNSGLPFLAQWNTMTLYPPCLFYVLLPLPWALGVFNLLHLILGGLGMYFLARRWTGNTTAAVCAGAAFAFSGLSLHCLMWPNNMAALGWMPWVVWRVERAWSRGGTAVITAGTVCALQVLSGAPEILIFTWLIVAAMFTGNAWQSAGSRLSLVRKMFMIALLTAGLSAAQMFPFLDLALHSHRNRDFGGNTWAMPAWGWVNLIVPMFRCTPSRLGVFSQDEQQWTSSYYSGIGVVAFALMALCVVRRPVVWLLGGVMLGGLVLALGKNGYVHPALREVFPLLGFVRFPIKFVVLASFALPLLAAFGLDWIQRTSLENPARARGWLIRIGVLLAILVAGVLIVARSFPVENESLPKTLGSGLSRMGLLGVVLLGAWFGRKDSGRWRWIGFTLAVAVCLDGLTHMPRQNPTVPVEAYGPMQLNMTTVPRVGEARAMIAPVTQRFMENASAPTPVETLLGQRRTLFSNCNLSEGVPKVNGFYSLYLKEEAEVRALLYGSTNAHLPALMDFLGVAEESSGKEFMAWETRESALPLVTAGQAPEFLSASETLDWLASPKFDPRSTVGLPLEARAGLSVENLGSATVRSSRATAHRIEADVEAAGSALVVIAQAFYHPWRATVDGQPAQLWRANHAFQALRIPPGKHRVELVYRDRAFAVGLGISLLTALGAIAAWLWLRRHTAGSSKMESRSQELHGPE